MSKKGRRMEIVPAAVICFSICISILLSSVPGSLVQAKKQNGVSAAAKSALKAYKKLLSKKRATIKMNDGAKYQCDLSKDLFAVCDLNNDKIPELLLYTEREFGLATTALTMTYYKGKIRGVLASGHGVPGYYPKGNVFMDSFCHGGYSIECAYKLTKGKLKLLARTEDDTAAVPNPKGKIYYVKGKKVSKKKYMAYMNKLTRSTMKREKYLTKMWHKITEKNIKKYVR